MATYRKTKTGWRVEICINRVRDSATRTTKAEARAWADQREGEIRDGRPAGGGELTVGDVFTRYSREISTKKRGMRWEQVRLLKLGRDKLAQVPLDTLTKTELIDWRDRRLAEVSPGSVIREMTLVAHALDVARSEWELIDVNPMADVKKPRAPRPRTRRPTDDESDRLVLALGWWEKCKITDMSQRVAIAYLFAIETAMRAGEICSLLPDNVDLKRRTAHLDMTKNGLSRDVPLSRRAVALLKQLQPWGDTVFQLNVKSLDVFFRRAKDNCKIKGLTFHDTRREATSRLAKILNPLELARVTGHKDLKMLLVYYQESAEEIAKKLG